MAAELLRTFPGVRLTATDYDDTMVSAARERLAGFGNRATTQQADATKLPFPDGSFDCVLSFIMLHHVLDWEGALREATRVLRPGGRVIGYDLLSSLPLRLFHQLEGSGHRTRMMRLNELRHELREIPVVGIASRSLGGITVRFDLAKQVTPSK